MCLLFLKVPDDQSRFGEFRRLWDLGAHTLECLTAAKIALAEMLDELRVDITDHHEHQVTRADQRLIIGAHVFNPPTTDRFLGADREHRIGMGGKERLIKLLKTHRPELISPASNLLDLQALLALEFFVGNRRVEQTSGE